MSSRNPQHRGVRVPDPTSRIQVLTSKELYDRRLPVLAAATLTPLAKAILGAERTRHLLNRAIGDVIYFTDDRMIAGVDGWALGTFGFILAPGGCEWALEEGGGCAFCNYQDAVDKGVGNLPLSAGEFTALFMAGFSTMLDTCDAIGYFTAGSATNPGEIPPQALHRIAHAVADAPRVKTLRIESRVQWTTRALVEPVAQILQAKGKVLDIAIGFETLDERIRNKLLNKGMGRKQFERAVEVLRELGVRVTVYVMLKGHWLLGEGYAIEECLRTIAYLADLGVDEVQLQPLFITDNDTEMSQRFRKGEITPPKLFSVATVFQRVLADPKTRNLKVILGPLDTELPIPLALPANCPKCTPAFWELITRWRKTFDPRIWTSPLPQCSCQTAWKEEVRNTMAPPAYTAALPHAEDEEDLGAEA